MVGYVKTSCFAGLEANDLQDVQRQINVWIEAVADIRKIDGLSPNTTVLSRSTAMSVVKAISNSELAALANRLRLSLIRDRMEEMLGLAAEKRLSPRETLVFFFRQEIVRREENRIRQGIMGAHFPAVRSLDDVDFDAQLSIDAKQVRERSQLE